MLRGVQDSAIEERLDVLTGSPGAGSGKNRKSAVTDLLIRPLDSDRLGRLEKAIARIGNVRILLEQADINIPPARFLMISMGLAVIAAVICLVSGLHPALAPVAGVAMAILPVFWCLFKRKRRLAAFQKQLPDALELIGRALRAGHSLAAGFQLVAGEMADPVGTEMGRVYEEQNLGIPLDEALEDLAERIPNLDLRFFATAVVLQRQTGGDLAEILDKIGHLVRERFQVWGQVQALTGEGRLSGVVLLALPPVLFAAIYRLNPEYIEILFSDPLGKKMLIFAVIMQIIGALVIRKIVDIKV